MMKHMTFAAALATATALSAAAMAAGSGDKAYQTQQGAQMERGAQTQQGAQMGQTSGAAMGQAAGISGENLDSEDIRRIQQALKDAGHDINADGIWGDNTAQALYAYQENQGLQASGELDAQTVAQLGVDLDGMGAMRTQQAETPQDSGMPAGDPGTGVTTTD